MDTTKRKRTIAESSVDTNILYERIKVMNVDETVTYQELTELIGRNVQKSARYNLTSARNRALREDHIVTEAITNVGIRRMQDEQIVTTVGRAVRRRIRSASRKGLQKVTAVDYQRLPRTLQARHNAEVSQLSAIAAFSKDHYTSRLENAAEKAPIALGKTINFFKGDASDDE